MAKRDEYVTSGGEHSPARLSASKVLEALEGGFRITGEDDGTMPSAHAVVDLLYAARLLPDDVLMDILPPIVDWEWSVVGGYMRGYLRGVS